MKEIKGFKTACVFFMIVLIVAIVLLVSIMLFFNDTYHIDVRNVYVGEQRQYSITVEADIIAFGISARGKEEVFSKAIYEAAGVYGEKKSLSDFYKELRAVIETTAKRERLKIFIKKLNYWGNNWFNEE